MVYATRLINILLLPYSGLRWVALRIGFLQAKPRTTSAKTLLFVEA